MFPVSFRSQRDVERKTLSPGGRNTVVKFRSSSDKTTSTDQPATTTGPANDGEQVEVAPQATPTAEVVRNEHPSPSNPTLKEAETSPRAQARSGEQLTPLQENGDPLLEKSLSAFEASPSSAFAKTAETLPSKSRQPRYRKNSVAEALGEEMFSIQDLADFLRVSKNTVRARIEDGDIETVRVGHLVRIRRKTVEKYISQRDR
ncbi:MAG: helix-turn-helix domain-containing protein [Polaromonas sp.]|uniref:helix-turn-helix domain-containing protein n=1 Tax=Polaromonas sp. TaxID=1869339 RepID=UPI0025DAABD9|nr:helix-turn-helix domain-containing protein [Polaromonas sp.]MBI2727214.1 helix-turn-helix domain-containing protein [Polaromonas sp.]